MNLESHKAGKEEERKMATPIPGSEPSSSDGWVKEVAERLPHEKSWGVMVHEAEEQVLHPKEDDGGMW